MAKNLKVVGKNTIRATETSICFRGEGELVPATWNTVWQHLWTLTTKASVFHAWINVLKESTHVCFRFMHRVPRQLKRRGNNEKCLSKNELTNTLYSAVVVLCKQARKKRTHGKWFKLWVSKSKDAHAVDKLRACHKVQVGSSPGWGEWDRVGISRMEVVLGYSFYN